MKDSVTILGVKHSIKIVDPEDMDEGKEGYYQSGKCAIVIQRGPKDRMMQNLMHEIIHAGENALGLELTEVQVSGVAAVVHSVLSTNPKVRGEYE